MTQAEFAERIGAGRTQLVGWERGNRYPDPESWARICEFTGASSDYLLLGRTAFLPADLERALLKIQRSTGKPEK